MTKTTADLYDALTLELERADSLTEHLVGQLSDLSETHEEVYSLSLIADVIRERHALIRDNAKALRDSMGGAR